MATRPGLITGLRSLLGGFAWLFTTPGAWLFAMVPLLLLVAVGGTLAALSISFVPDLVARFMGKGEGIGVGALKILVTAAAVVLSSLLAFALAQPLSGPALERIVRMQEAAVGAPTRPPTPFWLDIVRSLKSVLIGYAFGLPAALLLLLASVVLPFSAVVTVPLKLLVAAFTIAWDLCDYPLSIRGLRVRERVRIIGRYKTAVLGFSLGLALAGLVPCLLFLFLPAGVAGATRLLFAIEQYEKASPVRGG